MSTKSEITWKRRTEAGDKREVNARLNGGEWRFLHRGGRFDRWEPLPQPDLEDWLMLLDNVERRIQRRLAKPEEAPRLRQRIKELFPEAAC